jgi:hypothetical protein
MDHWSYYMDYFASALALLDSGQDDSAVTDPVTPADSDGSIDAGWQVADSTLEMCRDFLSLVLTENEALSRRLRGPYLAYLEFYRRLHERGENPEELLGISLFFYATCTQAHTHICTRTCTHTCACTHICTHAHNV